MSALSERKMEVKEINEAKGSDSPLPRVFYTEALKRKAKELAHHNISYKEALHLLQRILFLLQNNDKITEQVSTELKVYEPDKIIAIVEDYIGKVGQYKPVDSFENELVEIFKRFIDDQKNLNYDLLIPLQEKVTEYYKKSIINFSDQIENSIKILAKDIGSILDGLGGIEKLIGPILNKPGPIIGDEENFDQKELLRQTKERYSNMELERRLLLHENIRDIGTSRFKILDSICTILRKYRTQVREIFTTQSGSKKPKPRIKFRGSLVRNLKGYPKNGVAPTLNKYDCDAFIEVPEDWWDRLRKHAPLIMEKDEKIDKFKVSKKKLRDYEDPDRIEMDPSNRWRSSKQKSQEYESILTQLSDLAQIQKKIRKEISETGELKGYLKKQETLDGKLQEVPDFGFYLRPFNSVEKVYEEGNPYVKSMIKNRGYSEYAKELKEEPIREFAPALNIFKRPILSTIFNLDQKEYTGVNLPEYQAVIGKYNWYIEDIHLFKWRRNMKELWYYKPGKRLFSRRALFVYNQSTLSPISIQRDYLETPTDIKEAKTEPPDKRSKQLDAEQQLKNLTGPEVLLFREVNDMKVIIEGLYDLELEQTLAPFQLSLQPKEAGEVKDARCATFPELKKEVDAPNAGLRRTALSERPRYVGIFNGGPVIFEEDKLAGDGDCGLHGLGLSREQALKLLLEAKSNEGIRRLVAPEIMAAAIEGTLPASLRHDIGMQQLLKPFYEEHTGQKESKAVKEARERLLKYCAGLIPYKAFFSEYLGEGGWLTYSRNADVRQTSSIDALAQLRQVRVYIWQQSSGAVTLAHDSQTPEGNGVVHLLHTAGSTHYNLLSIPALAQALDQPAVLTEGGALFAAGREQKVAHGVNDQKLQLASGDSPSSAISNEPPLSPLPDGFSDLGKQKSVPNKDLKSVKDAKSDALMGVSKPKVKGQSPDDNHLTSSSSACSLPAPAPAESSSFPFWKKAAAAGAMVVGVRLHQKGKCVIS